MFPHQNYRGLEILPYPMHIKEMIEAVSAKGKRLYPDKSLFLYKGKELIPNFDKKLKMSRRKQELLAQQTPP